jgi:hypothetical protein
MANTVYAAREGSLIIAAKPMDHGLPPGGFLKFAPEVQFSTSRDIAGNVCRARINNPIVQVTLKLYNWSKHNQELSALLAADTLANNGAGIGVFQWKDNQGATLISSDTCWVNGLPPDWNPAEEAYEVSWPLIIIAPPEFMILGGN